jgi:hypothetical protein
MSFAHTNIKKRTEFYENLDNLIVLAKVIQRTPNESLKLEVKNRIRTRIESMEEGEPEREKLLAQYN